MAKFYELLAIAASVTLLAACSEWQPVYTFNYKADADFVPVTEADMNAMGTHITIADLLKMYTPGSEKPVTIEQDLWIGGKVNSSDEAGNIYKSIFIQDETAGVEIKIGRYSLYNEYKPGQTVYVYLNGLTIGMYGYKTGSYGGNGMIQVGMYDPKNQIDPTNAFDTDRYLREHPSATIPDFSALAYETSYMELPQLVDAHVFRGALGEPVAPAVLTPAELPAATATVNNCKYLGELVKLTNLSYANEQFTLVYLTYSASTKESKNRIFLSDAPWGVTTWAMSKNKMTEYLESGVWDAANIGNANDYNHGTVGDHKNVEGGNGNTYGDIERNAYSVSQYFTMGGKELSIRTSGYCDFADYEIPADVLDGSRTIDAVGILSLYQGSIQLALIDEKSLTYSDTGDYLY